MYAHTITAVLVAASLAFAAAPAGAQSDPLALPPPPTVKKKPSKPTQVAMVRPSAKVTVRKRSFLDPGTETKARDEHRLDYAFPPGGGGSTYSNDYTITFQRSPLPTCFDLPGFCR
jgi:hypothetical protein